MFCKFCRHLAAKWVRKPGKHWDFVITHEHLIEMAKGVFRVIQKKRSDFETKVTHVKMLLWKSEKKTDLSLPKQASIHPAEYPAWSPNRYRCRLLMLSTMGCRLIPSWRCNIFHSVCKSVKGTKKGGRGSKDEKSLCICAYFISALCRNCAANHGGDFVIIRESSNNFKSVYDSDLRN